LVNTWNEESNLPRALASLVDWVDEIVVVDMHSEDRTRDVATGFGARVYLHDCTDFVEPARAFGVQRCTGDWILILDADEIVPGRLATRLCAIADQDRMDVVTVPRSNFLLGRPFRGGGWGPQQDQHPRFFRRGTLTFDERIHSKPAAVAGARILELPPLEPATIVHFNYLSAAQVIDKLNRYTTIEAKQRFDRRAKQPTVSALLDAATEFLNRYVRLRGYRDGWRGVFMCAAMAFYRISIAVKLLELQQIGTEEDVKRRYDEIAAHTPRFARQTSEAEQ
jgi:glycosyltransferase involved in cell wall biosynthesis